MRWEGSRSDGFRMYTLSGTYDRQYFLLSEPMFCLFCPEMEFQKDIDFVRLAANRIYRPSYISLQYALSFYGMIPESVVQFTSVTTLKTANFENLWGQFSYQNVKESLMFGYEPHVVSHPLANGQAFMMATPEKALLDFLYLNPYYNTHDELEELRLDEDFMTESLNRERLLDFLQKFKSKILDKRINNLLEIYG